MPNYVMPFCVGKGEMQPWPHEDYLDMELLSKMINVRTNHYMSELKKDCERNKPTIAG